MARSAAPTRIAWRALQPDGIAHAFRGAGRALCGIQNQAEQWDHPTKSKCATCRAEAALS